MPRLSISLLGGFDVSLDGAPATAFESDKVRALLAYLVVGSERPQPRGVLAGLLWPERPEALAHHSLNQALYSLRRAVGDREAAPPFLRITHQAVQFNSESDYWLDAAAFCGLLDACQAHGPGPGEGCVCDACLERLTQAAALYRGGFLDGFSVGDSAPFEEWWLLQRERFQRLALQTVHDLARILEARGAYEEALRQARRQLELDPWQEVAHRQVMRLLALSGRRAAALEHYQACRRALAEALGVEPEGETTGLYERIRAEAAAPLAGPTRRHNLPAPLTPIVGREAELERMDGLLRDPDCRLLTLVGPGGIGKSRLALAAAGAQTERFPDGVFLVSLTPLHSVETLAPATAGALGFAFHDAGEPGEQLLGYLRNKSLLLILDNLETLLQAPSPGAHDAANWVMELLRAAPGVKILITSRRRLNVKGEQLFPLTGLAYPTGGDAPGLTECDAVRLFLQGARRARPDYEPAGADWEGIGRICRLVEGNPLGILLAAAWLRVLPPAEIATQALRDLDFLESDWQDLPERQRSMRAVFEHSWRLLGQWEREVLQALSVFRGGCTRDAAEGVTGATLRELMALVNQSLLDHAPAERYDLHELVRSYAGEKLAGAPVVSEGARERHSAYYLAALEGWGEALHGSGQELALGELDAEAANLRAAWEWAAEAGDVAKLGGATEGLCRYYEMRVRYEEGRAACRLGEEGLAGRPAPEGLRVRAALLTWQAQFCLYLEQGEDANSLLGRAEALLDKAEEGGVDVGHARAFLIAVQAQATDRCDLSAAGRLYERSLALYRAVGDRWREAWALNRLGFVAWHTSGPGAALARMEESAALFQSLKDERKLTALLEQVFPPYWLQGRYEEAAAMSRQYAATLAQRGNRRDRGLGLQILATRLCLLEGRFDESVAAGLQALPLFEECGDHRSVFWCRFYLSLAYLHQGQYAETRTLAQRADAWARASGEPRLIGLCLTLLGSIDLAEGMHGHASELLKGSVEVLRGVGLSANLALALPVLSMAQSHLGLVAPARASLVEALRLAVRDGYAATLAWSLPGAALLDTIDELGERGVELYTAASGLPFVANSRWFDDVVGQEIERAAARLPREAVEAARERGRACDVKRAAEALLAELEVDQSA